MQENSQHLKRALDNGEWQWLDTLDKNGLTPLHFVARSGWRRGAQLLLQANASTEVRDCQDFTPLMIAVRYRQKDIVQLLFQSKRALGHPRIFINTDRPEISVCTYCGIPFLGQPSFQYCGFWISSAGLNLRTAWSMAAKSTINGVIGERASPKAP
jgi:uncharacterized Zn-finger protein